MPTNDKSNYQQMKEHSLLTNGNPHDWFICIRQGELAVFTRCLTVAIVHSRSVKIIIDMKLLA